MKEKFKLTSLERKWVMYDVGNSAFTLMVSTLIPIYFNMLASETGLAFPIKRAARSRSSSR